MLDHEIEHITPPFPASELPKETSEFAQAEKEPKTFPRASRQPSGEKPLEAAVEVQASQAAPEQEQDPEYMKALHNLELVINAGVNPADLKIGNNLSEGRVPASMLNEAVYPEQAGQDSAKEKPA